MIIWITFSLVWILLLLLIELYFIKYKNEHVEIAMKRKSEKRNKNIIRFDLIEYSKLNFTKYRWNDCSWWIIIIIKNKTIKKHLLYSFIYKNEEHLISFPNEKNIENFSFVQFVPWFLIKIAQINENLNKINIYY